MSESSLLYRGFVPGDEFLLAALIKEVFGQFVAPDLCPGDAAVFLESQAPRFIYFRFLFGNTFIIVAQDKKTANFLSTPGVAGFIEVEKHSHISLLFVKKERQRQGIAKQLIAEAVKKCLAFNPSLANITLNSTPSAWPIYERLGFKKTDRTFGRPAKNSIPMVLQLR